MTYVQEQVNAKIMVIASNNDSVREALKLMKRGKSDGYDRLTSDYLKSSCQHVI